MRMEEWVKARLRIQIARAGWTHFQRKGRYMRDVEEREHVNGTCGLGQMRMELPQVEWERH